MTRKHPAQELEEDVLVRTSNMGQGRSDYEAFHTLSPAIQKLAELSLKSPQFVDADRLREKSDVGLVM